MNWIFALLDISFIGTTLHLIGEVMIAYTVLQVHFRMWQEHKIDAVVFKAMKRERFVGVMGISLIIMGYLLQLFSILSLEIFR